jgi:hypothetical protein
MDALEFIASVIHALAWPAAIVILVLVLRGALHKLIPALSPYGMPVCYSALTPFE